MAKDTTNLIRGVADDALTGFEVGNVLTGALEEIIAISTQPEVIRIVVDALKEASAIMGARQVMVEAEKVLEVGQ